jgi:hypothetical protein
MATINDVQTHGQPLSKSLSNHIESSGITGYELRQFWDDATTVVSQRYIVVRTMGSGTGDQYILNDRARVVFISLPSENPIPMQDTALMLLAWLRDNFTGAGFTGLYQFGNVSDIMPMDNGRYACEFEFSVKLG